MLEQGQKQGDECEKSRGQICNSSTWEVEEGGSVTQGQPQLHRKFETSLGYMRLYLGGCGGSESQELNQPSTCIPETMSQSQLLAKVGVVV